ncbi:hypothetical protein [Devosia aquimaris]|uniref:hypothetical protein n=1 Tax=Devosia aquimaris TaxID=2866214 RepID=UPI001CD1070C|nr:hypothetical protein [Devosia sp. CJK-A8-3]
MSQSEYRIVQVPIWIYVSSGNGYRYSPVFGPMDERANLTRDRLVAALDQTQFVKQFSLMGKPVTDSIIVRGFELRGIYLRELASVATPHERSKGNRIVSSDGVLDDLAYSVLQDFNFSSILSERDFLIGLPVSDFRSALIAYCLGGAYLDSPLPQPITDASPAARSIIWETLSPTNPSVSELRNKLTESVASVMQLHLGTTEDVFKLLNTLGIPTVGAGIDGMRRSLLSARKHIVRVMGPDLPTLLCILCDAQADLEHFDIPTYVALSEVWGVATLVAKLLWLRRWSRIRNYDDVAERFTTELFAKRGNQDPFLGHLLSGEGIVKSDDMESLDRIILKIREIAYSIDRNDFSRTVEQIVELYNTDPYSCWFLDWTSLTIAIRREPRIVSPEMALVNLLCGHPNVGRRHRSVRIRKGDGAYESSMLSLVDSFPNPKIFSLAKSAEGLSGFARSMYLSSLLKPSTIAVLAVALNHQPEWIQPLLQSAELRDDAKLSALRSDLATELAQLGMLEDEEANYILREEEATLGVLFLRGHKMLGTLRISWEDTGKQIASYFGDRLQFAKRLVDLNANEEDQIVPRMSALLASQIVSFVMLDGPDNVKTAISDGLKHNQLLNHFISAFQDAVTESRRSGRAQGYTPTRLRPLTADGQPTEVGALLNRLHDELTSAIKAYNTRHLAVDPESTVFVRSSTVVTRLLNADLAQPQNVLNANETIYKAVKLIKSEVDYFLSKAREELARTVQEYLIRITAIIPSEDWEGWGHDELGHTRFTEALSMQLATAVGEAARWIAIADPDERIEHFKFSNLVKLVALSHRPERPNLISSTTSRIIPGEGVVVTSSEYEVSGKFYAFLDSVCKNLISNGFKHSNMGKATKIQIELQVGRNELRVICQNTISTATAAKIRNELPELVRSANQASPKKAAEDTGSGLQKIIARGLQSLGSKPQIRLRLLSNPRRLEVGVILKHKGGSAIYEASSHS